VSVSNIVGADIFWVVVVVVPVDWVWCFLANALTSKQEGAGDRRGEGDT